MAGGMVIAASGIAAAETATLYPYVDFTFGSNPQGTILIGSTDQGQADGNLCLDIPLKASGVGIANWITDFTTPGAYGGTINGSGSGTTLDQAILGSDLTTQYPVCAGNGINFTATTSNLVDNVKHKGTLTLTTTADVQSGIKATSVTHIRVHCDAAQVVSISGAVIEAVTNATNNTTKATCNTNAATVDFALKPVAIKIKSSLNLTACNDVDSVVQLNVADDDVNARTNELDNSDAAHSYSPANAATKNVITIHECAQNTANVPGKALATKIAVIGAGNVTADVLFAQTSGPQLWDTTRGKTCSDAKETVTNTGTVAGVTGPLTQGARAMSCQGDYGIQIPFAIGVRDFKTAGGTDPKGLIHPPDPLAITGTMTIS